MDVCTSCRAWLILRSQWSLSRQMIHMWSVSVLLLTSRHLLLLVAKNTEREDNSENVSFTTVSMSIWCTYLYNQTRYRGHIFHIYRPHEAGHVSITGSNKDKSRINNTCNVTHKTAPQLLWDGKYVTKMYRCHSTLTVGRSESWDHQMWNRQPKPEWAKTWFHKLCHRMSAINHHYRVVRGNIVEVSWMSSVLVLREIRS